MRYQILIACALIALGESAWLGAQQEPPQTTKAYSAQTLVVQGVGDKESGAMFFSTTGESGGVPIVMSMGGFGGMGAMMGGPMPQDDLGMLSLDQFQKEIELVDDQKDRLEKLRAHLQEKRRVLYGDLKSMDPQTGTTLIAANLFGLGF